MLLFKNALLLLGNYVNKPVEQNSIACNNMGLSSLKIFKENDLWDKEFLFKEFLI